GQGQRGHGLRLLHHGERLLLVIADKAHRGALLHALAHAIGKMRKSAATNKENVARVELDKLLLRMLAPGSRRHIGDAALDDLEQSLLHTLATDVARDAGVIAALARDLVDLVDINNAISGALGVPAGILQQPNKDALHIFAHI